MSAFDFYDLRRTVSSSAGVGPGSGDHDFDSFCTSSLVTAFNAMVPAEFSLPVNGVVALEVASERGFLDAYSQGQLQEAVAEAIAFVGAGITHPESDVLRMTDLTRRQSLVMSRPTPTGAIAFLPLRAPVLPGLPREAVSERAMERLAEILPANPDDRDVEARVLSLRQPERRAVNSVATVARRLSGLSMLLMTNEDVVRSTVTDQQAEELTTLLRERRTETVTMKPVLGRLDGMRFSRQMFFLQTESGVERQGTVDSDLLPKAKQLLDRQVRATLQKVQTVRADGRRGRAAYRLVGIEPASGSDTLT